MGTQSIIQDLPQRLVSACHARSGADTADVATGRAEATRYYALLREELCEQQNEVRLLRPRQMQLVELPSRAANVQSIRSTH